MKTEKVLIKGAGSCGKTGFLLEKFRELLKEGVSPSKICVFCRIPLRKYFLNAVRENSPSGWSEIYIDSFSGFAKRAVIATSDNSIAAVITVISVCPAVIILKSFSPRLICRGRIGMLIS